MGTTTGSLMWQVGAKFHRMECGLAQGCPLSPALAGAVMAIWAASVEHGAAAEVAMASFVDDRLMWAAHAGC